MATRGAKREVTPYPVRFGAAYFDFLTREEVRQMSFIPVEEIDALLGKGKAAQIEADLERLVAAGKVSVEVGGNGKAYRFGNVSVEVSPTGWLLSGL